MRALYVGRFQPFHLGHLKVLKKVLDEYAELIILVGSAQHSHTVQNPFTAGERIQMIAETLDEEKVSQRVHVIPLDDIHRHSVWVSYVESLIPPFDVVFSNEPITNRLFKEAGLEVKEIELMEREKWSGTEIRRRIAHDESWEELVPPAVARTIIKIDGVARIRELAKSDKAQ